MVRGAGCCTKGPEFESRVRHGCQTVCLQPHGQSGSALNNWQTEVPGSFLSREVIMAKIYINFEQSKYTKMHQEETSSIGITTGARYTHRLRLSIQPFGVFLVFSETRVNTGQDPFERSPRKALHQQTQFPSETIGISTYTNTTLITKFT